MHLVNVPILKGFWVDGVLRPYFFENDIFQSVSVNGEYYRSMITKVLFSDFNKMWFQLNRNTCQTYYATRTEVKWAFDFFSCIDAVVC